MIEKARKILDKGQIFGALLTDLSKAFDCMTHDLLIARLHALYFDINALNLMFDYLTGRKQFSSYLDIFQGTPQGSILGPLLFNLFLCNLFLFVEKADMSYAEDNTRYENVDVTLGKVPLEWLSNNLIKANADKCHLILKIVSARLLVCFVCLKESTRETRKKVFYFISKALFVLEIIKP